MPWNTGVYTRGYPSWTNDANSNLPISATKFDTEDNDFAGGLNNCITKDGLSVPSVALSWGLASAQILALTRGNDGAIFSTARTGGANNPSLSISVQDAANTTTETVSGSLIFTGGGVQIGAPAGGSEGSGTINCQNVGPYVNGMLRQQTSGTVATFSTVETYCTAAYVIPANALQVGQVFRVTINGVCTTSVGNAVTPRVRIGTNGTVADSLVYTGTAMTSGTSGTGIGWQLVFEFQVTAGGASAAFIGNRVLVNQTPATGISSTGGGLGESGSGSSTFNNTGALKMGMTLQTAAGTTTLTLNSAIIELVG